jgi:hypothetical protein
MCGREVKLLELPKEIQFEVVRFLPPEAMARVREVSASARELVDTVIKEAKFTDAYGERVPDQMPVRERLEQWSRGTIGTPMWPPKMKPQTKQEIINALEEAFVNVNSDRGRSIWLLDTIEFTQGSPSMKVDTRASLSVYFQHLRDNNRLVDRDGHVISVDVPARDLIERMKGGDLRWLPPPLPGPPPQ